jgi:micrococcal nuclease
MRSIGFVLCLSLIVAPLEVWAHPGGLDADGCHNNRKTGEYHCHGGDSGNGSTGGTSGGSIYIAPAASSRARTKKQKPIAPEIRGGVSLVSVGDGDTIRVIAANGQKATIRLACIDAPETAQGQSGAEATGYLKQLLAGGSLKIQPQTVDRYGRTVAEVYTNGRNVNLAMVRGGQAYAYRDYLAGCDASAYLDAESQAERTRQGVWRWGEAQRPWDFRRESRQ